MNLTLLGTGNATVTHCYNTCFVLHESGQYLLVDGGGGNGLLCQLEKAHLRWQDMRTVFVTHKHMDHLLAHAHDVPVLAARDLRWRSRHLRP